MKFLLMHTDYLSESAPFFTISSFSLDRPPTGTLSLPVTNCNNCLFCLSVKEWTMSQKFLHDNVDNPQE